MNWQEEQKAYRKSINWKYKLFPTMSRYLPVCPICNGQLKNGWYKVCETHKECKIYNTFYGTFVFTDEYPKGITLQEYRAINKMLKAWDAKEEGNDPYMDYEIAKKEYAEHMERLKNIK